MMDATDSIYILERGGLFLADVHLTMTGAEPGCNYHLTKHWREASVLTAPQLRAVLPFVHRNHGDRRTHIILREFAAQWYGDCTSPHVNLNADTTE